MSAPKPAGVLHQVVVDQDGAALSSVLRTATSRPWSEVKRWIEQGKVLVDGAVSKAPGHRVRVGQTIVVVQRSSPARNVDGVQVDAEVLVHVDTHVVVVNKPAGISTVPFDEGEKGTLVDRVRILLHRRGAGADPPLFVVHRIDKETSGLLVFGRTWLAKRHLANLFRAHVAERSYLALVNGHVKQDRQTIESYLVDNRGDGLRGSAKMGGIGQRAVTHVEVVERLLSPATLVRCTLETGRTHQIRIHLSEMGHPLVGERVYTRHYRGPTHEADRMMLHAAELGFTHPAREDQWMRFKQNPPRDFTTVAEELGVTLRNLAVEEP